MEAAPGRFTTVSWRPSAAGPTLWNPLRGAQYDQHIIKYIKYAQHVLVPLFEPPISETNAQVHLFLQTNAPVPHFESPMLDKYDSIYCYVVTSVDLAKFSNM